MKNQIPLSSRIYDSLFKAKETLDNEYQEALDWITDIIENEERPKAKECEICSSNKKLELHHIRGCENGNEVVTACHECHVKLKAKQRLWYPSCHDIDTENNDAYLIRGLIDVCELKYQKTGKEIFKRFAEKLTEGFSYE